ncbi:arginase, partial [Clostridium saudiense]|nr:arginase [Clostridium saudiense]
MDISIIGMPLFYGCDRPGVEKVPDILRENNLDKILKKNHHVTDLGNIDVDY